MPFAYSSWISDMDYLTVEDAIDAPGIRLVLTAGVPGPWGEAAKYVLEHKGIAFTPVQQEGGGENLALQEWTGQNSAPVLVVDDLPPISHWLDLLMFAERHQPQPCLVPLDSEQRTTVLGLAALIAGVDGIGWNRRLQMLAPIMAMDEPVPAFARMARKYGWSAQAHADAPARLGNILTELDRRLVLQQGRGSAYFVGDNVTAADFYWASFSGMMKPLPQDLNPMPDFMRQTYSSAPDAVMSAFTPLLEAHRDRIFECYITLPLDY
jgi:glutathione S-transferase